ncbi:MAG: cell shape determination protein CcmA, partial [Oleibacter sp.]|nr:cell shape determination protein CcmA [Thalassolituus sp.]
MFSSKDKGANTHYDTLISSKTEITGDVKFTGGLHIDGV